MSKLKLRTKSQFQKESVKLQVASQVGFIVAEDLIGFQRNRNKHTLLTDEWNTNLLCRSNAIHCY